MCRYPQFKCAAAWISNPERVYTTLDISKFHICEPPDVLRETEWGGVPNSWSELNVSFPLSVVVIQGFKTHLDEIDCWTISPSIVMLRGIGAAHVFAHINIVVMTALR